MSQYLSLAWLRSRPSVTSISSPGRPHPQVAPPQTQPDPVRQSKLGLELLPESVLADMDAVLLSQIESLTWRCSFDGGSVRPVKVTKAKFIGDGIEVSFHCGSRPIGKKHFTIFVAGEPNRMSITGDMDDCNLPYVGFSATVQYD